MTDQKTNNRFNSFLLGIFVLLIDYLGVIAAEQSAYLFRNWYLHSTTMHISWLNFWVIFPIPYLIFNNMEQLYSRRRPFYKEVERIFYACFYGALTVIFLLYVTHLADTVSRLFMGFMGIFAFIYLTVLRYALKKFLVRYQLLQIPILIIGAGKTAELLVEYIRNDAGMGYKIVGLLEDREVRPGILTKYPVLGTFADVEKVVAETGVQHVFISAPGMKGEKLGWLIFIVQQLVEHVMVIPNISGAPLGNVTADSTFFSRLLILESKNCLADKTNMALKRVFDFVLTLIGTVLILPFLLLIALKIKSDSPGPVLYDGRRLGKDGKLFKCYKFRSMYVNGDEILADYFTKHPEKREEWETYHKLEDDPRVTKFGAFMRRTSLDELPQIFNVLLGEMSLVGPRPYLPNEFDDMGSLARTVLIARPGITGYWQVSGRSDVSFEERVRMDLWYICNWNLWLDMVMLFKTVKVVLWHKGAY